MAAVCLVKDRETLLSFYNFPRAAVELDQGAQHQQHRPGQARRREDASHRCARASRGKGDDPLRTMAPIREPGPGLVEAG